MLVGQGWCCRRDPSDNQVNVRLKDKAYENVREQEMLKREKLLVEKSCLRVREENHHTFTYLRRVLYSHGGGGPCK